jgi:iron complex transport system substrate-binding protein
MKTRMAAILIAAALFLGLCACSDSKDKGTVSFTDSAGRTVELSEKITKVAPSGVVATMILATLCPDYLVSIGGAPTEKQAAYLPKRLSSLPVTGQLYGSKSTINLEELINAGPQLIVDLGDKKEGIADDMDALQKQTEIATIFLEADLDSAAEAYRSLGKILGLEQRAEAIAAFIDENSLHGP